MSGFGSTGFGGFGQNNTTQSSGSGFGGFGSSTSGSAFGSGNTTGAFGSNTNTGGTGLFGSSGGGGFGSGSTGFGSGNTTSAFGAGSKPATGGFGTNTSSGGGLFGSNNTTSGSGFGGFGSNTNTNTSSGFGGSGGLFGGGAKPFGQNTTTATTGTGSTSLFGSGSTGGGFGGFGATNNPGIGGNVGDPPGTNATPFQAHQEKETTGTGNQSNSFQNILFQDPYKKWSAEELRLTDYNQGRRYGNTSGTGAFGVSSFGNTSGFGASNQQSTGFGSTPASGTSLFGGSNTNTGTSGFGSGTTSGFGSGGGLFGNQNKPATGGLFGSTTTSQPSQSGGLFGTASSGGTGTSTTGFGANASTGTGGLFGSNTQNKPGGFSFGNTGTTGSGFGTGTATSGFGTTGSGTSAGGGLFGSNTASTGTGLFGNQQQQQQQQQQQPTGTGGFGSGGFGGQQTQTGSLFGGNQQKPAGGLFGSNTGTSGGGLFGSGAGTGTATTSFGSTNNTASGGGLFGGQKPAGTGTGLFGSTTTQNTTGTGGGGLFGGTGTSSNQQTGSGLFQTNTQNQSKPGGLFGTSQTGTGGGLFGSQNTQQQQQQPSSLFGSTTNQQPQQAQAGSVLGGSFLGTSQNANAAPQQALTASISDLSAYGTPSLFSNLGANDVPNPGPLATPLSSKAKTRRSSILPMYKLNPASASRFVTPQKRGFGFSYSTYGTPTSPSSVSSTPGSMNRSLLGSSLNKGLSKSVSSSSLRKSFSAEDSILTPGAFSTSSGSRYYGTTGSMKKLVINKDMRSDLFSTPTRDKPALDQPNGSRKLSKRVSFDTSTTEEGESPGQDAATPRNASTAAEEQQAGPPNGAVSAGNGSPAGANEATGKELAIVHEEDVTPSRPTTHDSFDKAPGEYWMSPTQDAISSMNRVQRQKVANFTVGRDNVGYVCFQVPVDLTNIDLGDVPGGIVVLETRSATVYPNAAKKPPVGKGLNVPAIISLEQSWPRGRDKRPTADAKRINKHIERLKRIEDTTFIDYNADTGVWKFSVEHFTTYGLDYDDDETDAEQRDDAHNEHGNASDLSSHVSLGDEDMSEGQDDTFDFQRKRRALPGAFDSRAAMELDDEGDAAGDSNSQGDAFHLRYGSVGSKSNSLTLSTERDEEAIAVDDGYDTAEPDDELPLTPGPRSSAAPRGDSPEGSLGSPVLETPGGILRAKMRAMKSSMAPLELEVADGEDWMDMLQKSVSPQKRDRALLKSTMDAGAQASPVNNMPGRETRVVSDGRGFATSIDLMNSLFDKTKAPEPTHTAPVPSVGFVQWPYERQRKTFDDQSGLSEKDRAFYRSVKPSWGPDGTLVIPATSSLNRGAAKEASKTGIMSLSRTIPRDDGFGIAMLKFSNEASAKAIDNHIRSTQVAVVDGIPVVSLQAESLMNLFHDEDVSNSPANAHEKLVWELASILFDDVPSPGGAKDHSRKQRFSRFWEELVEPSTKQSVALAKSAEEKALVSLAGHRIQDACKHLIEGRNFRLATMVSIIGLSEQSKRDMRMQLDEWYNNNVLSEFDDAIRAMYELLAGNACVCEGKQDVPLADRMESFVISDRFSLNWKQAFGLRLWYVIAQQDDISAAVERFAEDVAQDREGWPQTWYAEQGIEPLWDDGERDRRQDLLWGLLQLFSNDGTDLEAVLRPENFQLSPLDARLCWQLWQGLLAVRKKSGMADSSEAADAATLSFADQLVNEGNWLRATFVLLHLSDPTARAKAVQDHLARHAGEIGTEDGETFATLTQSFRIPSAWIWEARALYMRSVRADAVAEVQCLLRALSYDTAHETLVRKVAPSAIVSRKYKQLAELLDEFQGHEESVRGWMLGGAIYKSFLEVRGLHEQRKEISGEVLEALVKALPAVRDASENSDTVQLAALSEMSGFVGRIVMDTSEAASRDASRILGLPLTEDSYLQHSLHLSHSYYQGIMAGAR